MVVLFAAALAVVTNLPLLDDFGRSIPGSLADPLVLAWAVQWGGHALVHQPLDLFQANVFWPLENTLAFTDGSLVGYSPVGAVGSGTTAALIHYNALFLFAYTLALVGAYALARELGASPLGAAVAGVAFAYAPWRHAHEIHSTCSRPAASRSRSFCSFAATGGATGVSCSPGGSSRRGS